MEYIRSLVAFKATKERPKSEQGPNNEAVSVLSETASFIE